MVSINDLYTDLITLINQNFYTKEDVDNRTGVVDITSSFKSYLTTEYEVNSNSFNNKLYLEIADTLEFSLKSLLTEYFDEEDYSLDNGVFFKLFSELCGDYITGLVLSDGSISILNNPEYFYDESVLDIMNKELNVRNYNYGYTDNDLFLHLVNVGSITLSSNTNNVSVGEEVTVNALVLDDNDDPLVNVAVDFYIDEVYHSTLFTNNQGIASLTFTENTEGEYTFQAECGEISSNELELSIISSYIELTFTGTTLTQRVNAISPLVGENVVIDYGDGTVVESDGNFGHTYNENGTYTIKIYDVISLGNNCFYDCTGLTSITLPSNVTSLGNHCFTNCTGLTSIIIPNSVTSLDEYCFSGCRGITSITIPNNVTNLPYACFSGCTGLTSIIIPNGVTSLGANCFMGCTGLTSIIIPQGVTSIGISCFSGCTGLTSIIIPNGVTSLGTNCFNYCTGLTSVVLNWSSSDTILTYNSKWISSSTNPNLVFSIPYGTTSLYEAKGYPSDKLVERSQGE